MCTGWGAVKSLTRMSCHGDIGQPEGIHGVPDWRLEERVNGTGEPGPGVSCRDELAAVQAAARRAVWGSLTHPFLPDLCAWVDLRGISSESTPPELPGGISGGVQ